MRAQQVVTVDEKFEWVCSLLRGAEPHGEYALAYCPAHPNTDTQALSVFKVPEGVSMKCQSRGCPRKEICEVIGIRESDLYVDSPNGRVGEGKVVPIDRTRKEREEDFEEAGYLGCTLERYAEEKKLPKDWLEEEFGLSDMTRHPKTKKPCVAIPYLDEDGQEKAVRYRTALRKPPKGKDQRFRWRSNTKANEQLYGLEKLKEMRENGGDPILVEGESDVHTLRHYGINALGVPGANNWNDAHAELLDGIERIYLIVEQGESGEKLKAALLGSPLRERLWFVDLGEHDDPSGLHLADPDAFEGRFREALTNATPYVDEEEEERRERARGLWEDCQELAESPDILAEFEKDFARAGVVGQKKEGKLLYLASTSRVLTRPTNVVVKGPSAGGKSYTLDKVLEFQPEEAFYLLSAMSDKALAYFDEPLKHRHLVIAEATALEGIQMGQMLLRELLSRGRLRYVVTVSTDNGPENKVIEVEGPTGLFMTTTRNKLHDENETRYASVGVDDTKGQSRAVLLNIAAEDDEARRVDFTRWHALQRWLALEGRKRVTIPYANWLARWIPDEALEIRIRRDFTQLLNLIRAHALLHQATRAMDGDGRVVASCRDYAAVRELMHDTLAEGLEASVPRTVRATVEALRKLYDALEDKAEGVPVEAIKDVLNISRSAASRRMSTAISRGFAKNLEEKEKQRAKYAPDNPLPEDITVLPAADELVASGMCSCAACAHAQRGVPEHENLHKTKNAPLVQEEVCGTPPHTSAQGAHLHMTEDTNHQGTPEQEEQIRGLTEQGMDPEIARVEVLGEEESGGTFFE